jgi:pyrrolidone-carboxylate peptidase
VAVARQLVIGAFQPFGGKRTNNAAEVAGRLEEMVHQGSLELPEDVRVSFVPLETSPESVDRFLEQASQAERVLMMGESGFATRVEARAHDRGQPGSLVGSALRELVPLPERAEALDSPAPVQEMARAAGARLSGDSGHYFCNFAYYTALQAGLNAVFVHVPSGFLGLGRQTDRAADQVKTMLETWYLADP